MTENWSSGFSTRSDTNHSVYLHRKAKIVKFWVCVDEEFYNPCSENRGAVRSAVTTKLSAPLFSHM